MLSAAFILKVCFAAALTSRCSLRVFIQAAEGGINSHAINGDWAHLLHSKNVNAWANGIIAADKPDWQSLKGAQHPAFYHFLNLSIALGDFAGDK